jgi:hypothetical protein
MCDASSQGSYVDGNPSTARSLVGRLIRANWTLLVFLSGTVAVFAWYAVNPDSAGVSILLRAIAVIGVAVHIKYLRQAQANKAIAKGRQDHWPLGMFLALVVMCLMLWFTLDQFVDLD